MMKTYLIVIVIVCSFAKAYAQPGCTDPQANNYDASAMENDGSCLYPMTLDTLDQVTELPESLIENSGLVYFQQNIYIHNDAGNANEIYRIDTLDGTIQQTLLVIGDNEDWEDMAESETHIFLGDFGNNKGNRTDLRIYKISKDELGNNILNAQPINFFYTDQTDFSENQNNHDFDCEAFFHYNDSLHLFTKNWVDNQTRYYTIPAEPGIHPAQPKHTFDVNGLITSADISDDGVVSLLGYTEVGQNFMWLLFDYAGTRFFDGHKRRIELGTGLVNSQTEAIAFRDNRSGYISSEQFDLGPLELAPKLMVFNIGDWIPNNTFTGVHAAEVQTATVFPNPFNDKITFDLSGIREAKDVEIRLLNLEGKVLLEKREEVADIPLTINNLEQFNAGIYILQLIGVDFFWQGKLVKL